MCKLEVPCTKGSSAGHLDTTHFYIRFGSPGTKTPACSCQSLSKDPCSR
ncbi:unnamed protein product [Ectocarpus fasciculatus]